MPERPRPVAIGSKLLCFSEAVAFNDGENVAFTIETQDRKRLRVNCPLPDLGNVFSFLGNLAKAAAEIQGKEDPPLPHTQNFLVPVPAHGMAFQAGNSPDETLLVMRLFGFDMAFAVSSSGLTALADDFARIARTLSAGPGIPQ
jgi:hypothetical protein